MVATYDLVCKPKRSTILHVSVVMDLGGYSMLIAPPSKKLEAITTGPFT